jgi:hypothetical protein
MNARDLLGAAKHGAHSVTSMSLIAAALAVVLGSGTARAGERHFCSATTAYQFEACRNEAGDTYLTAQARCLNLPEAGERRECFREAAAALKTGTQLCHKQRNARRDLCSALGEERYDPDFEPDRFDADFSGQNPHFPLKIGNRWTYEGSGETVTVEVLDKTKLIEGVTCIVVRDQVEQDGNLVEDTDDWFAQAKDGDVYYCGEEVKDLETFVGDRPPVPELVKIDGSFKAGRDGDKPGIAFLGSPERGEVYRQEWSPGNAEDAATVLSTRYSFGHRPALDKFVPPGLAQLLCHDHPCVVTAEFTPIEPDVRARKYYAFGIGLFLEVNLGTGDIVQLVGCNLDPKCTDLPTP